MLYSQAKLKEELEKRIEKFKNEIKKISTGKPNLDALENLTVDAYGVSNKLNAVAQFIVEDAITVKITVWDKSIFPNVEKALREANLGASVSIDGGALRLKYNPVTEEDRKIRVKDLAKMLEESRVQIRHVRQEFLKDVDSLEGVSEDEQKRDKESIQKEIDHAIKTVEEIAEKKENDLMSF